jgi:hypothetical protein
MMKLKSILVGTLSALSLGLALNSFAGHINTNNYYPPERINCSLHDGKLACEGFNHQYLVEDTYTADFSGKDQVFAFFSGAAYYTPNKGDATIFFTYQNSHAKSVKLKTVSPRIRPDFENGNWTKVHDDLYVCKEGYMSCPITALPDTQAR